MRKVARYVICRNYLIALAVVSLLLAVFLPCSPVSAAPLVTLVPSSGAVGTVVTISGTVFDSYEGDNIHIFFDNTEIEDSTFIVPPEGAFSVDFTVPAGAAAGQHSIKLKSEVGSTTFITENFFTVDATTLTLDAVEGATATRIIISGSGFYIGAPVTLYYYNPAAEKIGVVSASPVGKIVLNFTIPAGTGGFHNITAINDKGNSALVQFKVLPEIKLNLDSAGPGDLLNLRGTGFGSLSIVSIFFGLLNMGTAATDGLGNFEIEFSVPDVKSLSYDIKAQDDKGNAAITGFTVTAGANLSENTGSVGSQLVIHGTGFQAGVTVTVYYDDETIATKTTDNNGDFTVTITIPPSDGGIHVITVSDGASTRELSFSVETEPPPVPALLLPADSSFTRAETHFDWLDVTDVSVPVTYTLEIASDRNFSTVVLHKTGIADSEYTLTDAETLAADFKNAPYFWRVKAIDGAGNESEWSASRVFYISVPSMPVLVLPANDGQVELPIRFSWQAVSSLSPPITFVLQIATDLDFTSPMLDRTNLTNNDYLVSKDDNLKFKKGIAYYWRVKAIDAAHNESDWSVAGSFYVPSAGFPSWGTYSLISLGTIIIALLAFRLGRQTAFH